MKLIFIISLFFSTLLVSQDDVFIEEIRSQMNIAFKNEAAALPLYNKIKAQPNKRGLLLGYWGAINFAQASHVNIFRKMSFVNIGKKHLEKAIKQEPQSLELHFLRLIIQSRLPKFINYRQSIDSDKIFLINNINTGREKLKRNILKFAQASEYFNAKEKKLINKNVILN